jgi:hypothetical protein
VRAGTENVIFQAKVVLGAMAVPEVTAVPEELQQEPGNRD